MQIGMLRSGDVGVALNGRSTSFRSAELPGEPASMIDLITRFDELRPSVERLAEAGAERAGDSLSFDAPIRTPSKIWAAASNYVRGEGAGSGTGRGEAQSLTPDQILEMAFLKPPSAVIGPGESIVIPKAAETVFPELELCAVIGRRCRGLRREDALEAVFGYTIILDITARGYGSGTDGRITRCVRKGFDTFAPVGPWITTRDEILDPQSLWMRLWVNEEERQSASTGAMINDVATLVSYLSTVGTLEPGDLIATGNPDAPKYQQQLSAGDVLRAEVDGIGSMTLPVVREA